MLLIALIVGVSTLAPASPPPVVMAPQPLQPLQPLEIVEANQVILPEGLDADKAIGPVKEKVQPAMAPAPGGKVPADLGFPAKDDCKVDKVGGPLPERENFGTTVEFARNPLEAARSAAAERKLTFVLHVSGNFEDARFT
jgi:hypothetical protein